MTGGNFQRWRKLFVLLFFGLIFIFLGYMLLYRSKSKPQKVMIQLPIKLDPSTTTYGDFTFIDIRYAVGESDSSEELRQQLFTVYSVFKANHPEWDMEEPVQLSYHSGRVEMFIQHKPSCGCAPSGDSNSN